MTGYGGLNAFVAGAITLAAGFGMGLHHAVFGLLVMLMARRSTLGNRRPLLLAPVFWVAIELFRDRITGFPWNLLGYSQVDNIPFARISQLTGVYGLSFAVMLVNCAFVAAMLLPGRRRTNLLISAVAAAIALQIGVFAKPEPFVATQEAVLVQQNIPLDQGWTPQFFDQTVSSLAQISVSASPRHAPGSPGLIVWPESPAPFFIADPKLQHWLMAVAQDSGSYLIVGSLGQGPPDAQGERQLSNSALIMDPQGRAVGRYDKIHLVPFGEYVPFPDLLSFVKKHLQAGDTYC